MVPKRFFFQKIEPFLRIFHLCLAHERRVSFRGEAKDGQEPFIQADFISIGMRMEMHVRHKTRCVPGDKQRRVGNIVLETALSLAGEVKDRTFGNASEAVSVLA